MGVIAATEKQMIFFSLRAIKGNKNRARKVDGMNPSKGTARKYAAAKRTACKALTLCDPEASTGPGRVPDSDILLFFLQSRMRITAVMQTAK